MILGVGIARSSTLNHLEGFQRHLYRLDAPAVNGGGEYEGIGSLVVSAYAVVHRLALQYHFLHALYDFDGDEFIGKHKSEEHAFLLEELLLVLDSLLTLLRCPLALQLLLPFRCQLVMEGFEVGRADVLRLTNVLAEVAQEVYRVTPKRAVGNGVAVADADSHGCPIVLHVAGGVEVVAEHGGIVLPLSAFPHGCRSRVQG